MLDELKIRLQIKDDTQDDLLASLLLQAEDTILNYCNREPPLPSGLQRVALQIAAIYYNRLGAEGSLSVSQGARSETLAASEIDLPVSITNQLNTYRVIGVVKRE